MKIGIGNDHAGTEYKNIISEYIKEKYGYEVINYGTDSLESSNYPEFGEKVATAAKLSVEVTKADYLKCNLLITIYL